MPTLMQQMVDAQEPAVRHSAVESMRTFLRDDMDDLAYRKLWKGVLAAFWLCDLEPVQNELAENLGTLIHQLETTDAAKRWVGAFCALLKKDWDKLDKYRVDKYYSLMRHMVRGCFVYAAKREWAPEPTGALVEALDVGLLRSKPNGPRLHLCDVVLDEVAVDGHAAPDAKAQRLVLDPLLALLRDPDDTVFARCLTSVVERLLNPREEDGAKFFSPAKSALVHTQAVLDDLAPRAPQRRRGTLARLAAAFAARTGVALAVRPKVVGKIPSALLKTAAHPRPTEDADEEPEEDEAPDLVQALAADKKKRPTRKKKKKQQQQQQQHGGQPTAAATAAKSTKSPAAAVASKNSTKPPPSKKSKKQRRA